MTPKWLTKHATIHGSYTYKPNYLEILAGNAQGHALQVQLVPPGVLTNDDHKCVSVAMTIALDTLWADGRDHDPFFGVSDGEKFLGFRVVDKGNYVHQPPCYSTEGDDISNILANVVSNIAGQKANSQQGHSSEVKIQIKPCEKWGSCHTEHNQGLVFIANYQRNLDLTKGLYLDMYRNNAGETYRIEYITVAVELD